MVQAPIATPQWRLLSLRRQRSAPRRCAWFFSGRCSPPDPLPPRLSISSHPGSSLPPTAPPTSLRCFLCRNARWWSCRTPGMVALTALPTYQWAASSCGPFTSAACRSLTVFERISTLPPSSLSLRTRGFEHHLCPKTFRVPSPRCTAIGTTFRRCAGALWTAYAGFPTPYAPYPRG